MTGDRLADDVFAPGVVFEKFRDEISFLSRRSLELSKELQDQLLQVKTDTFRVEQLAEPGEVLWPGFVSQRTKNKPQLLSAKERLLGTLSKPLEDGGLAGFDLPHQPLGKE